LRPFYDVSFHSISDPATVNLAEYLVDHSFLERRPTLVVVTPLSPNVLQPDESYAEATTETLLRQIGADLGVKDTTEQVSKTIDFLKKLRERAKRSAQDETGKGQRERPAEPPEPAKSDKPQEAATTAVAQDDARGVRTVQLVVLPDTRPVWNSMSVFDRATVAERSLNEYLKKVPEKRARLLEHLDADQFRFSAYLGKEAVNQMMDSLGVRRPEFHVLVVDRNGEVVESWNKFNLDVKAVSTVYCRVAKETP
jgi:hypothetical protein